MRTPRPTRRELAVTAVGGLLIASGIICLYNSETARPDTSWRANTLDAFGVGLVIGGVVDVTAISMLDWISTDIANRVQERQRRQRRLELVRARRLLELSIPAPGAVRGQTRPTPQELQDMASQIDRFLDRDGDLIYAEDRRELQSLAEQLQAESKAPLSMPERADDARAASP